MGNEIEEDGEDDDEQRQFVTNLDGNIEDEQSSINSLFAEIEPLQNEKLDKVSECAQIKKALTTIENQLCDAQRSLNLKQEKFQTMTQNMMMQKRKIDKAPKYFEEKENELKKKQKEFEQETERINALKVDAQSCGEAISKEEYLRKDGRGRRYSLNELTRMRKKSEAEILAWKQSSNDPQEIRDKFAAIKPKYETHRERVDAVNRNVDETMLMLAHKKKQFDKMRQFVRESLSKSFCLIMRAQGHDGTLNVDYERKELSMNVHMLSHDGSKQIVNSATLSGGERSFTQVALIMALQKFSGAPFCIYDEFDVFMDSVNRGNSIKILLNAALGNAVDKKSKDQCEETRQYIFITPNDVSPVIQQGRANLIMIHRLRAPRK